MPFFVALQCHMLVRVWGQSSIGCFVQGECMSSVYLDVTSTPQGDLQCLEYCAGVEGSNYFTYDLQNSVSITNHFHAKKWFCCNLSFTALFLEWS